MASNLGATSLRRRRIAACPMQTYDALPPAVRQWIGQAVLPWSPTSCHRVWKKARAKGMSTDDALAALTRAETSALSREVSAIGSGARGNLSEANSHC